MNQISSTIQATAPIAIPAADSPPVQPTWARLCVTVVALAFAALAGASGAWLLILVAVLLVAAPAVIAHVFNRVDHLRAAITASTSQAVSDLESEISA